MKKIFNDFGYSITILIILFTVLILSHNANMNTIEEQHNVIYQQQSLIEDLKYQIGQCRSIQYSEYE